MMFGQFIYMLISVDVLVFCIVYVILRRRIATSQNPVGSLRRDLPNLSWVSHHSVNKSLNHVSDKILWQIKKINKSW